MLLDHHFESRIACFVDEPVAASGDEYDFVAIGIQGQCATQRDSSSSCHETRDNLSHSETLCHPPIPFDAGIGVKKLSRGAIGRSPSVSSQHGKPTANVRAT
jgi:hypothetical protein